MDNDIVSIYDALHNEVVCPIYRCERCGELVISCSDGLDLKEFGEGQNEVIQKWMESKDLPIMNLHMCVDGRTYGILKLVGFEIRPVEPDTHED